MPIFFALQLSRKIKRCTPESFYETVLLKSTAFVLLTVRSLKKVILSPEGGKCFIFWITCKGFSPVENVFICSLCKVSQNETLWYFNLSFKYLFVNSFKRTLLLGIFFLTSYVPIDPVAMLCSFLFESPLKAKGFSTAWILKQGVGQLFCSSIVLDESSFSSKLMLIPQRSLRLQLTEILKCAVSAHLSIAEWSREGPTIPNVEKTELGVYKWDVALCCSILDIDMRMLRVLPPKVRNPKLCSSRISPSNFHWLGQIWFTSLAVLIDNWVTGDLLSSLKTS